MKTICYYRHASCFLWRCYVGTVAGFAAGRWIKFEVWVWAKWGAGLRGLDIRAARMNIAGSF